MDRLVESARETRTASRPDADGRSVRRVDDAREVLPRVFAGDRAATRELVDRLAPVIWSRVTRAAQCGRHRTAEQVKQVGEDLMQEVFAALFEQEGRVLRGWTPERGLSLEGYVGMLAEHHALSVLRSGRKTAWREDATEEQALLRAAGTITSGTARLQARDTLVRIIERLRAELSPRGVQIFELLVLEQRSVEEVSGVTGMSADALYAWRSRLAKRAIQLRAQLEAISESRPSNRRRCRARSR